MDDRRESMVAREERKKQNDRWVGRMVPGSGMGVGSRGFDVGASRRCLRSTFISLSQITIVQTRTTTASLVGMCGGDFVLSRQISTLNEKKREKKRQKEEEEKEEEEEEEEEEEKETNAKKMGCSSFEFRYPRQDSG